MATGTTYHETYFDTYQRVNWVVTDDETKARASFRALISQKEGVEWRPASEAHADNLYLHFVWRLERIVDERYRGDWERVAAEKPKFGSNVPHIPFDT
jgi:hypothetical protein